jgi:hypothetical protein
LPSPRSSYELQITTVDLTDALGRALAGNSGQAGSRFTITFSRSGFVSVAQPSAAARSTRLAAAATVGRH